MTFEEQLDLVDQVMMDRSITARPGPRKQRLRELGLPDDADIRTSDEPLASPPQQ